MSVCVCVCVWVSACAWVCVCVFVGVHVCGRRSHLDKADELDPAAAGKILPSHLFRHRLPLTHAQTHKHTHALQQGEYHISTSHSQSFRILNHIVPINVTVDALLL